jgi:pentatricopeptide repeat protein
MEDLCKDGKIDGQPNTVSYGSVIDAYAQTGNAQAAERILTKMYEDYKKGNKNCVPNIRSFNTVTKAWARSGDKKAGERSEAILNHLTKLRNDGILEIWPNDVSYNSVMDAYAESGDADNAERVFELMVSDYNNGNKECKPNQRSYGTVIKAWAHSGKQNAGEGAEAFLNKMIKSGITPHAVAYNSAIDAYAQAGQVKEAQAMFDRMLQDYLSGNKDAKPTVISFNSLMHAWAVSKEHNAGIEADKILEQMGKEFGLQTTDVTLTTLRQCWLHSDHPNCEHRLKQIDADLKTKEGK